MNETSKSPIVIRNALLIVCLFALFPPGCKKKQENIQWKCSVRDIDGNVTVTTEKFTLILEGVSYGGASEGSIQVSGTGLTSGGIQPPPGKEGFVWSDSYDGKGVCNMTFGKAKLKIIGHGKTLVVGDQRFGLGKEKVVLRFKPDGSLVKTEPAVDR